MTKIIKNIEGAYKQGLKVGVYFYTCADTPQEAIEEANYLIKLLEPYKDKICFPIAFDIEDPTHYPGDKNNNNYKTKEEVSNIILAFTDTIKNLDTIQLYMLRKISCMKK